MDTPMTRDELKKKINNVARFLTYPDLDDLHAIDDCDATLREELAQVKQERDQVIAEAVLFAENVTRNGRWQEDEWLKARAFLASDTVAQWREREKEVPTEQKQPTRRSCNRHEDCDEADRQGRSIHCHTEDCEDCFGK